MTKRATTARKAPAKGKTLSAGSPERQDEEGRSFDTLGTNAEKRKKVSLERDARGCFLPRNAAPIAQPGERWSATVEKAFVERLGIDGSVAGAAKAAGVSEAAVLRQRRKSAPFRAAWDEAMREGAAKLEAAVLHRAIHGVEKVHFFGGKRVGSNFEYNDALALQVLNRLREAGAQAVAAADLSEAQIRDLVADRLSQANRRMGGQG